MCICVFADAIGSNDQTITGEENNQKIKNVHSMLIISLKNDV